MLVSLAKKVLPRFISESAHAYRNQQRLKALESEWSFVRAAPVKTDVLSKVRRVLIVPCDPWTVIGSVGDQAMITATIDYINQRFDDVSFWAVTANEQGDHVAHELGLGALRCWDERPFLDTYADLLQRNEIDAVFVLGADVLDGYYNTVVAAKLLLMADVAARLGLLSTVLGFSFNKVPRSELTCFFDGLHESVNVHVRDPISYRRFREFSKCAADLVADSAFLLKPNYSGASYDELRKWAETERGAGKVVIGLNAHPLLLKAGDSAGFDNLVHTIWNVLKNVSRARKVSWVLITHDYRDRVGDIEFVRRLSDVLRGGDVSFYVIPGVNTAAELKGFSSLMDGVVTGRMHLAIASLGSDVPVMALTYQDKFEGLFEHFDLPQWLLMRGESFFSEEEFSKKVVRFVDELPDLKSFVESRRLFVKEMAERNMAAIAV